METLGARLRRRRVERGMTIQQIADRVNVVPIYVSDIERGKRRPLKKELLVAIAAAYGLAHDEVERLALSSRDSVQLETKGMNDRRRQVAVQLARTLGEMPEDKFEKLRRILEED